MALLALFGLLSFANPSGAAETREYAVKAAFLFHLTQFVTWPSEAMPPPGEPLRIGVVEPNPFGAFLEEIVHDVTVDDHPIEVAYLRNGETIQRAQVVFLPRTAPPGAADDLLEHARGKPILLVGEELAFLERGGMIALVRQGDRIEIAMNLEALRKADLLASSRLMRLARITDNSPAP